jgi:phage terminase large subunit
MIWTKAARRIADLRSRIRIVQGGTSAGKTYAILQCLIFYALKHPFHISIVSESIPHLRRGVLKDFIKIMTETNLLIYPNFNKSTLTYTFENGSVLEFFSADQPDKLRGARRDILFINECNNIEYEAFTQLEVRTNNFVYLDFNPTHEFWVHENLLKKEVEHDFIKLTYKDNEALSKEIIKSIESKKGNEYWWKVYGLGEVGRLEGAIYKNWEEGEFDETLFCTYGLDFGWNPDPTALVKVAIDETKKCIYVKELCYSNNLSQEQIVEVLKINTKQNDIIVADSSDQRLIDSMYQKGFNIFKAEKGAGSVREGIMFIQDYKIIVTSDSYNYKKEIQNYCWNDKRAGIPIDKYNHLQDATRYALEKLRLPNFYFG